MGDNTNRHIKNPNLSVAKATQEQEVRQGDTFRACVTPEVEQQMFGFLYGAVHSTDVKFGHRLAACKLIMERTIPAKKTLTLEGEMRHTVNYVSPYAALTPGTPPSEEQPEKPQEDIVDAEFTETEW